MLALRRGEAEEVLRLTLETPRDEILFEMDRLFQRAETADWKDFFQKVISRCL